MKIRHLLLSGAALGIATVFVSASDAFASGLCDHGPCEPSAADSKNPTASFGFTGRAVSPRAVSVAAAHAIGLGHLVRRACPIHDSAFRMTGIPAVGIRIPFPTNHCGSCPPQPKPPIPVTPPMPPATSTTPTPTPAPPVQPPAPDQPGGQVSTRPQGAPETGGGPVETPAHAGLIVLQGGKMTDTATLDVLAERRRRKHRG